MTRRMKKPGAPRLAQQSVGSPFIIPNREPTPEFIPSLVNGMTGQPGLVDEILRGHPKVAKHVGDFRVALAAAKYKWEPVEDETIQEARFREDLEAVCKSAYVDAENELQGFGRVAESWLTHWTHGIYVGETRFVERTTQPRNYAALNNLEVEVYPIHPSTILQWNQADRYRKVTSLRQQSVTGGAEIPAADLIWEQRGGVIGELAGDSILRPLQFLFAQWKSLWLSRAQLVFSQGGLLVLTVGKSMNYGTEEWNRMVQSANGWQNGLSRTIVANEGSSAELHSPTGSVGGEEIETIDAYCDMVLGSQLSQLIASANGHRALGEVAADADAQQQVDELTTFLARFGQRFARWVAERCLFNGRLPTLTTEQVKPEQKAGDYVPLLITAVQAGLVDITPDVKAKVRELLGLPEIEDVQDVQPAAAAPLPADPLAAPMDDAPAGDVPPADAQRAAAHALDVRRNSPAELRGINHPSDLAITKKIAGGEPLTRVEMRVLEQWFAYCGDPTVQPDWEAKGPTYQNFMGRGGTAMATWLGAVLADTDGVPATELQ